MEFHHYSRLNDDLRTDQEVQNELHQRLVDLQDQLYDVADGRKEGKKPFFVLLAIMCSFE